MKKPNIVIYAVLFMLLAATALLAYLNRGDAELRKALEENSEFEVRVGGELVATIGLQMLVDSDPQEFVAAYATSSTSPRDARFKGVELRLVLDALDVDVDKAERIGVTGLDSYYSPLSKEEVESVDNVYICYEMDGDVLKPQGEGGIGPFLLVIRSESYAQRWCKYVTTIDVIMPRLID
ncbi:MAG: molybdopterin-dependent oxidoreductase [Oscillospiraceae bacterium]|nr:molybdopterin-dependent oxidoreductase [Oscillospiraceae bacterium]